MKVEQVNTAERTRLSVGGRDIETGIFKIPQSGRVPVGHLGLENDAVCNVKHHGGPDQAVYLYSAEDYAFWSRQQGKPVEAGAFGENITVSGFDLSELCVGDTLISDSLTLQIAAPRIPCSILAASMDDKQFVKKFMQANRSGAYCRVLVTGDVGAGDEFTFTPYDGDRLPLTTFFVDAKRPLGQETLERYLTLPIDERSRADFSSKLRKLE
ncbi:MAG: MOSC domain-containing protein YiiM [Candidatus Azotimanducaceae bacterium]|jgi:MOSC domain-containing protein YiiM